MNFKKVVIGTMIASQVVTMQMAQAFTVSVFSPIGPLRKIPWLKDIAVVKMERMSGHEEITRQALRVYLQYLKDDAGVDVMGNADKSKNPALARSLRAMLGGPESLTALLDGTNGALAESPVIMGNFATDMPDKDVYPETFASFRVERSLAPLFTIPKTQLTPTQKEAFTLLRAAFSQVVSSKQVTSLGGIQAFFLNLSMQRYARKELVGVTDTSARIVKLKKIVYELKRQIGTWGGNWHENPDGQVTHFLRNYQNSATEFGLVSAKDTCNDATQFMVDLTSEAMRLWGILAGAEVSKGVPSKEKLAELNQVRTAIMFLIGHVTHMLQDSFTSEHTIRGWAAGKADREMKEYFDSEVTRMSDKLDEKEKSAQLRERLVNYDIFDVCYYGKGQNQGITRQLKKGDFEPCYHEELGPDLKTVKMGFLSQTYSDFGDNIWNLGKKENNVRDNEKYTSLYRKTVAEWARRGELVDNSKSHDDSKANEEKWSHINHNARLARAATVRYLMAVTRYMNQVLERALETKRSVLISQAYADPNEKSALGFDPGFVKLQNMLKTEFFEGPARNLTNEKILLGKTMEANGLMTKKKLMVSDRGEDSNKREVGFAVPVVDVNELMPRGVFRCNLINN